MRVTYQTGRAALLAGAAWCAVAGAAWAAEAVDFDIAAGDLQAALTAYIDQTGEQLIYRVDDVRGVRTGGVNGRHETDAALEILLKDTEFDVHRDPTGATVIVRTSSAEQARRVPAGGTRLAQVAPSQRRTDPRRGPEAASDTAGDDEDETALEEMIVTGSNIRGAGAPAAAVIRLDAGDIDAGGFSTLDDVLNALPQNTPTLRLGASRTTAPGAGLPLATAGGAGIDLRGLGPGSTLTLLNGKRLAPAGRGEFFDVSMIPVSAIERVETVLDGGSPIYGTDAVAGTVNIILKDDFEGGETRLRYGTAFDGDGDEVRVGQLFGNSWANGNVTASYEFFSRDPLALAARNFLDRDPAPPGDLTPEMERHSAFVAVRQELNDRVQVKAEALYSFRDQVTSTPDLLVSRPDLDDSSARVEQLSFSGSLDWDVGSGWLVSAGGTYNELDADIETLRREIVDGVVNPEPFETTLRFDNSRFIVGSINADGPLFDLPAGPVKAAGGGEYRRQAFESVVPGSVSFPDVSAERDIWAVYGELSIPVVSPAMSFPGVHSLDLSVAGRFEHYSDFGGTTNPRVGVEWRPVEELTIKGSYGTSFRAPDFATQFISGAAQLFDFGPFLAPELGVESLIVLLANRAPTLGELEPENAETFSAGFDYAPAYLKGLRLSLNYFDISFEGRIARPGAPLDVVERALREPGRFPENIILFDPPAEVVQAVLASADIVRNRVPGLDFEDAELLADITTTNIATQRVNGLDVFMSYARDVGPGTLSTSLNLSFLFDNEQIITPGSEPIDVFNRVFFATDFRARGQLGWSGMGLTVNGFVNYSDGFLNDFVLEQRRVGSFTTIDANIAYDFSELSARAAFLSGLLLRVSILNLLDEDPPLLFASADEPRADTFAFDFDTVNADALGRRIAIELVKRW